MRDLTCKELSSLRDNFESYVGQPCKHCDNHSFIADLDGCKCKECYEATNLIETLDNLRERTKNTCLLYHLSFYDGPLTGVMLWHGKRAYFAFEQEVHDGIETWSVDQFNEYKKEYPLRNDLIDMIYTNRSFIYSVYDIPQDNMDTLDENHALFQKYVSLSTDYDLEGNRHHGILRPYCEHNKYYQGYQRQPKQPLDLKSCPVFGQFRR